MSGTRRDLRRNGSGPPSSMSATCPTAEESRAKNRCRATVSSTPAAASDCPATKYRRSHGIRRFAAISDQVPQPGRQGQHGPTRSAQAEVAISTSRSGLLKGTVWENYMLLPRNGRANFSKTDPNGAPAPVYLANSTLETFSQGKVPLASSSCMACHGNAVSYQSTDPPSFPGRQGIQPIGLHVHPRKGAVNFHDPA